MKTSSAKLNWKPGTKVESPLGDQTTCLEFSELEARDKYRFLISSVVPRPIAFVSTHSKEGVVNLAPYSFFNAVSSVPPVLMISMGYKAAGERKDSLRNILETEEFVIASSNSWLVEPLVHCAGSFSKDISEFEESGLTPLPAKHIKAPLVKEAAVNFECKLQQTVSMGGDKPGSTMVIFGEIICAHVNNEVLEANTVLFEKYQPVGRLGSIDYGEVGEVYSIPVPKVV